MAGSHHVLLIGGHGKIAQMLTPLLLKRSWTVTSLVRTQDQAPAIEKLGKGLPGKLNVVVRSIEDATDQDHAEEILNEVKPDYVTFAAGAGGKGGAERTFKIDRDAATAFIYAAAAVPSITRFLLISFIGSRRDGASWWPSGKWDHFQETVNQGSLADYYKAKIAADEVLYETAKKGSTLTAISLRPGTLADEPAGKVELGKTKNLEGSVSRESVAQVADALLAADGVKSGWIDLLDGDDEVQTAVDEAVKDGVDTAEGEQVYGVSR